MTTPNQPGKPTATGTAKATTSKPASQPVKQTEKPLTNDIATSTNSDDAKVQSITGTSESTGTESPQTINDNIVKEPTVGEAIPGKTFDSLFGMDKQLMAEGEDELRKASLQSEKKTLREVEPKIPVPTAGRGVFFHFAPEDGICSNSHVDVLAAFVSKADGLKPSLSVFTMDSRDPVVLRRDIPHISVAPKDSEDTPIKPYWEWPVIYR